ncbi:MAG: DUF2442 domain-containing protein [Bacteroidaceae bacterium]|nr:DUF2442 domain-containing protein [Bacteroidaceae bacterium]
MVTRKDIENVWTDNTHIHVKTKSGRSAKYAFADWSRLANATNEQRQAYTLSFFGIHWEELDEDLSFDGMLSEG